MWYFYDKLFPCNFFAFPCLFYKTVHPPPNYHGINSIFFPSLHGYRIESMLLYFYMHFVIRTANCVDLMRFLVRKQLVIKLSNQLRYQKCGCITLDSDIQSAICTTYTYLSPSNGKFSYFAFVVDDENAHNISKCISQRRNKINNGEKSILFHFHSFVSQWYLALFILKNIELFFYP